MTEMPRIKIGRYDTEGPDAVGQYYSGWVEPEDRSWILFIDVEGKPHFFPERDPQTGAVLREAKLRKSKA